MSERRGRTPKSIALEALGWLLLVAGVVMLAIPGPGLLGILAGLLLLSQQYEWAERRVEPVRLRALESAAQGVETWPRIMGSLLGVVALVVLGVYWISAPPVPSWWPIDDSTWLLGSLWTEKGLIGGLWTGVVQIASAGIALALIIYSFRRFRGHPEELAELRGEIDEADDAADGHVDRTPSVDG